jgi:hypothetical protein|tara:strand:- start:222 stop:512 length:291 start_codon:yes stop_codon:yes gene_type:complete
MFPVAIARSRMAVFGRHIQTMTLSENILFPTTRAYIDVSPNVIEGYTIQVDVRHDEKIIDFVTEAMCPNEKRNVYLRQKRMMREMYPEYMITERHT